MKLYKKIIIIIFISLVLTLLWEFILFPSYLSVYASCNTEGFNEDYGDQYYTAGSVSVSEGETTLYLLDETNIPVKKHEECHLNQIEHNRLYSCNHLFLKYLNEVECYTIQRFWELK